MIETLARKELLLNFNKLLQALSLAEIFFFHMTDICNQLRNRDAQIYELKIIPGKSILQFYRIHSAMTVSLQNACESDW